MSPEKFHHLIEQRRAEVSKEAMEHPVGGDAFTYGKMCGLYAGLGMAVDIMAGMFADDEERGRAL